VNNQAPILVTGAHRSGTTWVGRMLAANSQTAYISEPLNVLHRAGVYHAAVDHWYPYITIENEAHYLPAFHELLDLQYDLFAEIKSIRSRRDLMRMGRDLAIFTNGKLRRQRILLKDPFALFSVPWFAERLNCQVVITVRHPAAFASSLKRLNWPFDFQHLLNQPGLMHDHLEGDRGEMQAMNVDDIVGQAALLWRMTYRFVHSISSLFPNFNIVRHEDLSLNPVAGYQALYESLDLKFDEKVKDTILHSSSSENPTRLAKDQTFSVKLDSRAALNNWKKILSAEEISRVRKMTEDVSPIFYSEDEWK
jgi:hypothetical protein